MTNTTTNSALNEMDYRMVESQFKRDPQAVSVPCQLRFIQQPAQDTDRFHDELSTREFEPVDTDPARGAGERPAYNGEVCSSENYKLVHIRVLGSGRVRIYPREDQPTADELARIIDAIELGFGAELEHYPIDRDS